MIVRKIMLLGEMAVGKTSIANRLAFDRFETSYKSTIGLDIYLYELDVGPNGERFQFMVWDTDGGIGDAMFRHQSMKGAQAAIVVGDLTRRETMLTQLQLTRKFSDEFPGRYVAGVINKHDLAGEIPEDAEYIPKGLREPFFPVFETSAKSGLNIKRTFEEAAQTIMRRGM